MGSRLGFRRSTLFAGLCVVQIATTALAAIAAFVDVESILGTGPTIALLGLVIAYCSIRCHSPTLLQFDLFCPVVSSVVALLIASFDWGPSEAEGPVQAILAITAIAALGWGVPTVSQVARWEGHATAKLSFRFSLLGLLGITSLTCVLFAVWRQLVGRGEMAWFAAYGIAVLVLSAGIAVRFVVLGAAPATEQPTSTDGTSPG